ncbi:hypothetical protein [Acidovorax sp. PRC11]|uniref:hypothetical protein n=1 Tax=Acidovorax sp. PRC11 TaxID=2962592 RepID=UPI002880F387|nr:hypothetical protein [Acidovorax sp. PRC11]MDT0140252.1 hypothetical protein [Acidovorax sp. PRC11]
MAPRTKPGGRSGSSSSHGSRPAASQKGAPNTRRHVYIDTAAAKGNCAKDVGAIEKKCAPETPTEKDSRQKSAPGPLGKLKLPTHSGKAANPDAQWINDHCEFLMIKPSSPDEMFKELENIPAQMADELGMKALEAVEAKAKEKLESAVKAKLAKMAVKQGLVRAGSFLGGPWTGVAVNILMTAGWRRRCDQGCGGVSGTEARSRAGGRQDQGREGADRRHPGSTGQLHEPGRQLQQAEDGHRHDDRDREVEPVYSGASLCAGALQGDAESLVRARWKGVLSGAIWSPCVAQCDV